jgi:hypothetical protein
MSSGNQCQKCNDNCKDCDGSTDFCKSCKDKQVLSLLDNKCLDSCPLGLSIYDTNQNLCKPCDPTCGTCRGAPDFCTSCPKNMNLIEKTGKCTGSCSNNNKLVSLGGKCVPCSQQCETCVNKPDSCLSC